jgi:hypothetical protein
MKPCSVGHVRFWLLELLDANMGKAWTETGDKATSN